MGLGGGSGVPALLVGLGTEGTGQVASLSMSGQNYQNKGRTSERSIHTLVSRYLHSVHYS